MRILLVEDDLRIAKYVKEALEKQSYAVDHVDNGDDGFSKGIKNPYDMILMDVMLPGRTGLSLCHDLRSDQVSVPIIMISGKAEVDDRINGLDSGADDYLTKPFSVRELMARIRAQNRRKAVVPQQKVEISGLMVDFDKRIAYREGKQLHLSPKEYRILEYFARNPHKALSRYDIIENVWGEGLYMYSNVVDVHISNLRRKLNKGFEEKLIRTVRGDGYML